MANRLQMNIIIIKISVANPLSIILKRSLPNRWQSHYKSTKCKKERGVAVINDFIDAIVAASEENVKQTITILSNLLDMFLNYSRSNNK